MSGIPASRKMWITPLSPVHMGTDEDYAPTGYVIEDNALYEFDQSAVANLPEAERRSLDNLLSGKATADMLKNVQGFFYKNREGLIPAATNIVHISDELASMYRARVGKAANVEASGKRVFNSLEIERASYNPSDRRLFFPGSGLKGAMRTALLDAVNNGQRPQKGERNRDLQQRLFQYSMRDLNKDPMRLVQVGDCAWQGQDTLNSAEVLFAVNRKKHPVMKDGRAVSSQAEQRGLYQMLECATPFRFRAFQGLLNIAELNGLSSTRDNLPSFRFSFGEIATACNRFYRPIFDAEMKLLRTQGYLDNHWLESIQALLANENIQTRLKNNDAFLLRVGRHSGAQSVTVNGVRSIKIIKGKGERPAWEPEAKTLWLATGDKDDKRYLRPFGWLLVELTELNEQPAPWPEAEKISKNHEARMHQWLEQVQSRRQILQTKAEEIRLQREQQAQEAAEREAKVEAEREREAARIAAMTPLELEIEALCKRDPNNPAAILFNQLKAGHWEKTEDQQIVAKKIQSIWQSEKRWNPDFTGSNKSKVKQRDRCQEVLKYL